MKRLLIIGGGLAGLSAAWHARRAGAEVRVLEISPHPGGVAQSFWENGFLTETGPNSLLNNNESLQKLLDELALDKKIVEAAPAAKERFVVREGKLVAVPMSVSQFLTSPLLSIAAKFRVMGEPWAKARTAGTTGEESLADFARRRFGAETFTYGLEPFVAGIFAGDPEKLSARHALPKLQAMENKHGSVVRGALQAKRQRDSNAPRRLISFHDGLGALPRALAGQLGDSVILQARLLSLERDTNGIWTAGWETPGGRWQEKFDGVVLAVPAYALATLPLPPTLLDQLQPLAKIEYPPVSVVTLGYRRHDVGHPLDGFGALIPAVEKFSILGVLFNSTLFPGRAPAGHVLLTAFVGGARQPGLAALPDEQLVALVQADFGKLLAASGPPVFQKIVRWPRAIPQYNLDHGQVLQTIEAVERAWPGLALAGSYHSGVSVAQTLETGSAAGRRALNLSPSDGE